MFKAFLISFRLRNAYRTNGIIYSLKSIPLVRRLLPSSLYANRGLKTFANVVSGISEISSIFLWKALYLGLVFLAAVKLGGAVGFGGSAEAVADMAVIGFGNGAEGAAAAVSGLTAAITSGLAADKFAHMLIFLTIIGGFLNTHLFDPTKDKFYAIFTMRMDARIYTLSNYYYFLLKNVVGLLPMSLLFGLISGASVLTCLLVPLYVVAVKLCFTVRTLARYRAKGAEVSENKLTAVRWVSIVLLLAAALVPPLFGFALPQLFFCILTVILLIPGVLALRYVAGFDGFRSLCKQLLRPEMFAAAVGGSAVGVAQQVAMQKTISADLSLTSNKSGYQYFNELFVKRHSKIMTRSAKRMTAITAVVFAAAIAACVLFPSCHDEVNELMLTYLPYFLFVMYLMNRGAVITRAMFMNCDHSMLAYRFYRQPKAILALFVLRLKYIIMINLSPALVIALSLPILLLVTGGTDQPLNYLLLFVSIIAMSVFFSVHNTVLYYLLQPYNVELEMKNATYKIISVVTYLVCYAAIRLQAPTLIFGSLISAFCIIYVVVALFLAYRLAPRTFRLR